MNPRSTHIAEATNFFSGFVRRRCKERRTARSTPMATIKTRRRANGATRYTAIVRIREGNALVFFD